MKTSAVLAALLAAILTIFAAVTEFAGGYSAFPLMVPFMFLPAASLEAIMILLASCWAIVGGCVVLWHGYIRSTALIAVLLCFSWISLRFVAGPAFLMGFAARLRVCSSAAEIAEASRSCRSLMPQGGHAYGPERMTYTSADEAKEMQPLSDSISKYPFVHLGHGCAVFVRPPVVTFEWGGVLTGYWGIQFMSAPGKPSHLHSVRFSDNILLFEDD